MNQTSTPPLITSWTDYAAAVARVLACAGHSLVVFDRDLMTLHLDHPAQIASLTGFLRRSPSTTLRIALQQPEALRNHHPRLLELLRTYAHKFHVQETPRHLASLSDSLLIADGESAVIRFHHDHARSKEIVADAEACKSYVRRFENIWNEGGTPLSASVTGL